MELFQLEHVKAQWDNAEKTILLCEFWQGWTWDEYFDGVNWIYNHTVERGAPIDVITLNTFKSFSLPQGNALVRFKEEFPKFAGTGCKIAYVNAPILVRTLNRVYETMFPSSKGSTFFASTIEEARQILREQRRTSQPVSE